jgi:thiol:disulfide interchange protein DsbA
MLIKSINRYKGYLIMKAQSLFSTLFVICLSLGLVACSDDPEYIEEQHFTVFENAVDDLVERDPAIKESAVIEFFSYGCSHCKTFSPLLAKWKNKNNIHVQYIPVVWNENTELHAKVFYLASQQEDFKTLHHKLFTLVAGFGRTDSLEDQKIAFIEWFQQQGIQPIETLKALNSSDYEEQLALSVLLAKRFKITGTPTLVVNQQYRINNKAAGSQQEILDIAASLLEE